MQYLMTANSFDNSPLKWYQWVWSSLPLLLIIVGGAFGGLFGGIAFVANRQLFRSTVNNIAKYSLSGLVSIFTVIAFLSVAFHFDLTLHSFAATAATAASEFKSEEGAFSVMTPYTLQEMTQPVNTLIGKVEAHIFIGSKGDTTMAVMYTDYPIEIVRGGDSEKILNGVRDGILAKLKGKLVAEKKISLNNYPGLAIMLSAKEAHGFNVVARVRLFLVHNRLYQVMAVTAKGKERNSEIEDFLQSFKLLEE